MALPLAMIVPAIISGLAAGAVTMVGRALIGLGVAVFTYKGITVSLDLLLDQVKDLFTRLPPEICGISNLLQIDVCISILFSAYAASLALGGLTSDSVKRWGIK